MHSTTVNRKRESIESEEYRLIEHSKAYSRIVETRYPEAGYADVLKDISAKRASPSGAPFLAMRDAAAVGSDASHPLDEENCENGRVFIIAEARDLGLAVCHCNRMTSQTQSQGFCRLVFDSAVPLTNSRRLYGKLGFAEPSSHQPILDEALPRPVFHKVTP